MCQCLQIVTFIVVVVVIISSFDRLPASDASHSANTLRMNHRTAGRSARERLSHLWPLALAALWSTPEVAISVSSSTNPANCVCVCSGDPLCSDCVTTLCVSITFNTMANDDKGMKMP